MQEPVVKNYTVTTDHIELNVTKPKNDSINLKQSSEATIRIPVNPESNSILIQLSMDLSDDSSETVNVHIENSVEFEISETPDDYTEFGETVCLPIAQKEQIKLVESILGMLGFTPLSQE